MALKASNRFRKLVLAACGMLFGSGAVGTVPSAHADFTNRIQRVQENLSQKTAEGAETPAAARVLGSLPPDAWANTTCDGTWYNSWYNGPGGWGNSTCDGSWSNSWSNV